MMAQQHQGLQPAWNSSSNNHQWNGPTPPSPNALINGAWENQMAAAAAAFQPNGFTSSPPQHHPWGSQSSSGRREESPKACTPCIQSCLFILFWACFVKVAMSLFDLH